MPDYAPMPLRRYSIPQGDSLPCALSPQLPPAEHAPASQREAWMRLLLAVERRLREMRP